jgi:hypothetical protein
MSKTTENLSQDSRRQNEIRTEHLPNMTLEHYRYTNLLCEGNRYENSFRPSYICKRGALKH